MPVAADRSNAQPHQLIHRSGTAARSPARSPANYVRHRRQAFAQHEGGDVLDAAVWTLVKFVSPVDPRWLTTLDAVRANLVSDSLTHRYDPQVAPDVFSGVEGTFSICSF